MKRSFRCVGRFNPQLEKIGHYAEKVQRPQNQALPPRYLGVRSQRVNQGQD